MEDLDGLIKRLEAQKGRDRERSLPQKWMIQGPSISLAAEVASVTSEAVAGAGEHGAPLTLASGRLTVYSSSCINIAGFAVGLRQALLRPPGYLRGYVSWRVPAGRKLAALHGGFTRTLVWSERVVRRIILKEFFNVPQRLSLLEFGAALRSALLRELSRLSCRQAGPAPQRQDSYCHLEMVVAE